MGGTVAGSELGSGRDGVARASVGRTGKRDRDGAAERGRGRGRGRDRAGWRGFKRAARRRWDKGPFGRRESWAGTWYAR